MYQRILCGNWKRRNHKGWRGIHQRLWEDANSYFYEIEELAKKDERGNLAGIWGTMSDLSHTFQPWEEDFSKGCYLAGVECVDGAEASAGCRVCFNSLTLPKENVIF